jgi:hypothetical protein
VHIKQRSQKFFRKQTKIGNIDSRLSSPRAIAGIWGADRVDIRLSLNTRAAGDTPLERKTSAPREYFRPLTRPGPPGLALECRLFRPQLTSAN